jgi:hypothetical protein
MLSNLQFSVTFIWPENRIINHLCKSAICHIQNFYGIGRILWIYIWPTIFNLATLCCMLSTFYISCYGPVHISKLSVLVAQNTHWHFCTGLLEHVLLHPSVPSLYFLHILPSLSSWTKGQNSYCVCSAQQSGAQKQTCFKKLNMMAKSI